MRRESVWDGSRARSTIRLYAWYTNRRPAGCEIRMPAGAGCRKLAKMRGGGEENRRKTQIRWGNGVRGVQEALRKGYRPNSRGEEFLIKAARTPAGALPPTAE